MADDHEPFCLVWEAVAQEMLNATPADVAASLTELVSHGLVALPPGMACDRPKILDGLGAKHDSEYWFALTETGSAAWQLNAERLGGTPITWDEAWVCDLNHKSGAGSIQGTTEAVCSKALDSLSLWNEGFHLDRASLRHTAIAGFFAKYHKFLSGGHRIDFRFHKPEKV